MREVGKGRKSADVGQGSRSRFEQRRFFGCGRSGSAVLCTLFCSAPSRSAGCCALLRFAPPHSAGCSVLYFVLPPTFGGVLCFTVSRPVRRGSVPLLCPHLLVAGGSGGKPSNVTKKQNIPQRGLQITGFLLYYPKKQIFNSAQRCRQGWNFGEVQLRL